MAQAITSFIDRIQLGEDEAHQIAIGSSAYGICNTVANNANKIVYLPGFKLNTGTTIHVHFIHGNTALNPTLNINAITYESPDTPPPIESISGVSIDELPDGAILTLTYDGTAWVKDYGGTGGNNVDLTGVMRIIGQVNSTSEYQPSHMTWGTPTLSGMASGEYSPQVGDVISDADGTHEYMCVNVDDSYGGFWFMVGTIMPEYDSDDEMPSTDDGSLTWISQITQNEDGSISTSRTTLDVVPIVNGGTGTNSFSTNEVIVSDSTGDSLTSVPYSDYDSTEDPTGASVPSLGSSSTNFVTERYIYYGLPNINDDHNYNSNTTIYVPLNSGVTGQLLVSGGSNVAEPQWEQNTLLISTNNEIDDTTELLLGSNTHAGIIGLYSTTGVHVFSIDKPVNPTFDNTPIEHTFPSTQGYIVQSSGLDAGNFESPIYLENGIIQESLPIILKWNFTIEIGQSSVTLPNPFFNAHTYVTQIVVDQGMENLNGPIDWISSDATEVEGTPVPSNITLTTTATSGTVSGYILISRGNDVPNT